MRRLEPGACAGISRKQTSHQDMTTSSSDVYTAIADQIIAVIETGAYGMFSPDCGLCYH